MTRPSSEAAGAIKLSANPNAAMLEMMTIIDSFRAVMMKETDALESADAAAFLDMQDEKLIVARAYQTGMEQLLARKEQLRAADPALRHRLEGMQRSFHDITVRNLNGLERMKNGTNRLHEKIMLAARDNAINETRFAYGAAGKMQDGGKVSIGLSEQV